MPGPLSETTTLAPQGVVSVRSVTVDPGGVWRTALSSEHAQHLEHAALVAARERRGSDIGHDDATRGAVASTCISRAASAASSPSSSSSCATVKPPASSLERSSRSVASFVSRCTCSPIVSRNSLRSASVRPPSVSSSR